MANANRYYLYPFAENGNKATVPNLSTGGAVSYDTGYGSDYELAQSVPNRKRIERTFYNGILNAITENLKQWQQHNFPTWIESDGEIVSSPYAYSKGAIVSHVGINYTSVVSGNQEEPGTGSNWNVIDFSISSVPDSRKVNGKPLTSDVVIATSDIEGLDDALFSKIGATNYATNATGGTLKARLGGTVLYLTNNGNDA